jgi:hypothetical protein
VYQSKAAKNGGGEEIRMKTFRRSLLAFHAGKRSSYHSGAVRAQRIPLNKADPTHCPRCKSLTYREGPDLVCLCGWRESYYFFSFEGRYIFFLNIVNNT